MFLIDNVDSDSSFGNIQKTYQNYQTYTYTYIYTYTVHTCVPFLGICRFSVASIKNIHLHPHPYIHHNYPSSFWIT